MPYNRKAAVNYAREWYNKRNPEYADFEELGGDCTNFVSQCIYAGARVMNYRPDVGWYYISLNDRAAAWSGVEFLRRFLVNNTAEGPYGRELPLREAQPGDVVQISFDGAVFTHTTIVLQTGFSPTVSNILIAAHTYDSLDRALNTYAYREIRLIHIDDVRGKA
jgi:hypothetical protein